MAELGDPGAVRACAASLRGAAQQLRTALETADGIVSDFVASTQGLTVVPQEWVTGVETTYGQHVSAGQLNGQAVRATGRRVGGHALDTPPPNASQVVIGALEQLANALEQLANALDQLQNTDSMGLARYAAARGLPVTLEDAIPKDAISKQHDAGILTLVYDALVGVATVLLMIRMGPLSLLEMTAIGAGAGVAAGAGNYLITWSIEGGSFSPAALFASAAEGGVLGAGTSLAGGAAMRWLAAARPEVQVVGGAVSSGAGYFATDVGLQAATNGGNVNWSRAGEGALTTTVLGLALGAGMKATPGTEGPAAGGPRDGPGGPGPSGPLKGPPPGERISPLPAEFAAMERQFSPQQQQLAKALGPAPAAPGATAEGQGGARMAMATRAQGTADPVTGATPTTSEAVRLAPASGTSAPGPGVSADGSVVAAGRASSTRAPGLPGDAGGSGGGGGGAGVGGGGAGGGAGVGGDEGAVGPARERLATTPAVPEAMIREIDGIGAPGGGYAGAVVLDGRHDRPVTTPTLRDVAIREIDGPRAPAVGSPTVAGNGSRAEAAPPVIAGGGVEHGVPAGAIRVGPMDVARAEAPSTPAVGGGLRLSAGGIVGPAVGQAPPSPGLEPPAPPAQAPSHWSGPPSPSAELSPPHRLVVSVEPGRQAPAGVSQLEGQGQRPPGTPLRLTPATPTDSVQPGSAMGGMAGTAWPKTQTQPLDGPAVLQAPAPPVPQEDPGQGTLRRTEAAIPIVDRPPLAVTTPRPLTVTDVPGASTAVPGAPPAPEGSRVSPQALPTAMPPGGGALRSPQSELVEVPQGTRIEGAPAVPMEDRPVSPAWPGAVGQPAVEPVGEPPPASPTEPGPPPGIGRPGEAPEGSSTVPGLPPGVEGPLRPGLAAPPALVDPPDQQVGPEAVPQSAPLVVVSPGSQRPANLPPGGVRMSAGADAHSGDEPSTSHGPAESEDPGQQGPRLVVPAEGTVGFDEVVAWLRGILSPEVVDQFVVRQRSEPVEWWALFHGGGGAPNRLVARRRRRAVVRASRRLRELIEERGATALLAVVLAVAGMEDHPDLIAGLGTGPNRLDEFEMDAGVAMAPPTRTGAVEGAGEIERDGRRFVLRYPSLVALLLSLIERNGDPDVLVGKGAVEFGARYGVPLRSVEEMRAAHERGIEEKYGLVGDTHGDTVGAIVAIREAEGWTVAVDGSTGGFPEKEWARAGDVGHMSAGYWAEVAKLLSKALGQEVTPGLAMVLACHLTGVGEGTIRIGAAQGWADGVKYGEWPVDMAAQILGKIAEQRVAGRPAWAALIGFAGRDGHVVPVIAQGVHHFPVVFASSSQTTVHLVSPPDTWEPGQPVPPDGWRFNRTLPKKRNGVYWFSNTSGKPRDDAGEEVMAERVRDLRDQIQQVSNTRDPAALPEGVGKLWTATSAIMEALALPTIPDYLRAEAQSLSKTANRLLSEWIKRRGPAAYVDLMALDPRLTVRFPWMSHHQNWAGRRTPSAPPGVAPEGPGAEAPSGGTDSPGPDGGAGPDDPPDADGNGSPATPRGTGPGGRGGSGAGPMQGEEPPPTAAGGAAGDPEGGQPPDDGTPGGAGGEGVGGGGPRAGMKGPIASLVPGGQPATLKELPGQSPAVQPVEGSLALRVTPIQDTLAAAMPADSGQAASVRDINAYRDRATRVTGEAARPAEGEASVTDLGAYRDRVTGEAARPAEGAATPVPSRSDDLAQRPPRTQLRLTPATPPDSLPPGSAMGGMAGTAWPKTQTQPLDGPAVLQTPAPPVPQEDPGRGTMRRADAAIPIEDPPRLAVTTPARPEVGWKPPPNPASPPPDGRTPPPLEVTTPSSPLAPPPAPPMPSLPPTPPLAEAFTDPARSGAPVHLEPSVGAMVGLGAGAAGGGATLTVAETAPRPSLRVSPMPAAEAAAMGTSVLGNAADTTTQGEAAGLAAAPSGAPGGSRLRLGPTPEEAGGTIARVGVAASQLPSAPSGKPPSLPRLTVPVTLRLSPGEKAPQATVLVQPRSELSGGQTLEVSGTKVTLGATAAVPLEQPLAAPKVPTSPAVPLEQPLVAPKVPTSPTWQTQPSRLDVARPTPLEASPSGKQTVTSGPASLPPKLMPSPPGAPATTPSSGPSPLNAPRPPWRPGDRQDTEYPDPTRIAGDPCKIPYPTTKSMPNRTTAWPSAPPTPPDSPAPAPVTEIPAPVPSPQPGVSAPAGAPAGTSPGLAPRIVDSAADGTGEEGGTSGENPVEPAVENPPAVERQSGLRVLWRFLRRRWELWSGTVVMVLGSGLSGGLVPILGERVYALARGSSTGVAALIADITMGGTIVVSYLLMTWGIRTLTALAPQVRHDITMALFEGANALDSRVHREQGETIVKKVLDAKNVASLISQTYPSIVSTVVTLISSLVSALVWAPGLLPALLLPVVGVVPITIRLRRLQTKYAALAHEWEKELETMIQQLGGEDGEALVYQYPGLYERVEEASEQYAKWSRKTQVLTTMAWGLTGALSALPVPLVYFLYELSRTHHLSLPMVGLETVVAFSIAAATWGQAAGIVAKSALGSRELWQGLFRAFDLLDPSQPARKAARDLDGDPAKGVRLQDVVYKIGDRGILNRVSLELPAGSSLAVVGGSGTGKTMLGMLLLGFATASGGKVEVGGVPAERLKPGRVLSLTQNPVVVSGTFRDALSLGGPIDPEKALALLRRLGLGEKLGEAELDAPARGLSGGEATRTAAARILLGEPLLLILDEPTAKLDARTASQVRELIFAAARELGQTMVAITHDFGTADCCDVAVVLGENGQIEEWGPPADLRQAGGAYADLRDRQLRPELDPLRKLQARLSSEPGVDREAVQLLLRPFLCKPGDVGEAWRRLLELLERLSTEVDPALERALQAVLDGLETAGLRDQHQALARAAAPRPTAEELQQALAREAREDREKATLKSLRQRLDGLGVAPALYRLGEVADNAWCMVREAEDQWAVFWSESGVRHHLLVFDDTDQRAAVDQAAAYLRTKVVLKGWSRAGLRDQHQAPLRAAAPKPTAEEQQPALAREAREDGEKATLKSLRQRLGELRVDLALYRLDDVADNTWCMVREAEGRWAVFWSERGERHRLHVFDNVDGAAAYLLAKFTLRQWRR